MTRTTNVAASEGPLIEGSLWASDDAAIDAGPLPTHPPVPLAQEVEVNGHTASDAKSVETLTAETLPDDVAEASDRPKIESWRDEVAVRLQRYRTRHKPKSPRYPSLRLPFDAPESWFLPASQSEPEGSNLAEELRVGFDSDHTDNQESACGLQDNWQSHSIEMYEIPTEVRSELALPIVQQAAETTAKILEFPRSAAIPVYRASELADPIFDRPRIVEAPEILPPPPALGGMMMEPAQREIFDRRAGADSHAFVAPASIPRRVFASLIDGMIVASAVVACAAIFLRLNPAREPLTTLAIAMGTAAGLLWMAYEFVFIIYTGSTPGLRVARLQLARFDGTAVPRNQRRWRVLASFLSAFSAGLGYFWSVLDQDALCWHDRISHSYVQVAPRD